MTTANGQSLGMQLKPLTAVDGCGLCVAGVDADGQAGRTGQVHAGDVVTHVNGVDVMKMKLGNIAGLIKSNPTCLLRLAAAAYVLQKEAETPVPATPGFVGNGDAGDAGGGWEATESFSPVPSPSPSPSPVPVPESAHEPAAAVPPAPAAAPAPNLVAPSNVPMTWVALYDYSGQDEDEVSFDEGDTILNVAPLQDGWASGTVKRTGKSGSFPETYVQESAVTVGETSVAADSTKPDAAAELLLATGKTWIAIYDYTADDSDEITFKEGDYFVDVMPYTAGWVVATLASNGVTGSAPEQYIVQVVSAGNKVAAEAAVPTAPETATAPEPQSSTITVEDVAAAAAATAIAEPEQQQQQQQDASKDGEEDDVEGSNPFGPESDNENDEQDEDKNPFGPESEEEDAAVFTSATSSGTEREVNLDGNPENPFGVSDDEPEPEPEQPVPSDEPAPARAPVPVVESERAEDPKPAPAPEPAATVTKAASAASKPAAIVTNATSAAFVPKRAGSPPPQPPRRTSSLSSPPPPKPRSLPPPKPTSPPPPMPTLLPPPQKPSLQPTLAHAEAAWGNVASINVAAPNLGAAAAATAATAFMESAGRKAHAESAGKSPKSTRESKARSQIEMLKEAKKKRLCAASNPSPAKAEAEESSECKEYQVDILATEFGTCKCGLPRINHSAKALEGSSSRRSSISGSGGGSRQSSWAPPPAVTPGLVSLALQTFNDANGSSSSDGDDDDDAAADNDTHGRANDDSRGTSAALREKAPPQTKTKKAKAATPPPVKTRKSPATRATSRPAPPPAATATATATATAPAPAPAPACINEDESESGGTHQGAQQSQVGIALRLKKQTKHPPAVAPRRKRLAGKAPPPISPRKGKAARKATADAEVGAAGDATGAAGKDEGWNSKFTQLWLESHFLPELAALVATHGLNELDLFEALDEELEAEGISAAERARHAVLVANSECARWRPNETVGWLVFNELPEAAEMFRQHNLDGTDLLEANDVDLDTAGVPPPERNKLRKLVQEGPMWSIDAVVDWLESSNLPMVAAGLAEYGGLGTEVFEIDDGILEVFGVGDEEQARFKQALKKLRGKK